MRRNKVTVWVPVAMVTLIAVALLAVSNRGNPRALPGDSQSVTDTGVVFEPAELGTG
jgi:hypothetical protein